MWDLVINSAVLGVGLAMDACAVSMANGLNEPKMKPGKQTLIALAFGVFQFVMPMIGWVCVRLVAEEFAAFNKAVPYIALALLAFVGGKMIFEGCSHKDEGEEKCAKTLNFWGLMTQSVATSIDALSVGFTIAEHDTAEALISAGIIGVITFAISFASVFVGKKFGDKLGNKAEIFGGCILIAIGIKIFVQGVFFS